MNNTDNLVAFLSCARESGKGIFFIEDAAHETFLSYDDLFVQASIVLNNLKMSGLTAGDKLIIQVEDNQTFIIIFWACLLGSIIPVPLTLAQTDEYRLKLLKVRGVLKNPYIVFDQKVCTDFLDYLHRDGHGNIVPEIQKKTISPVAILRGEMINAISFPAPSDIAYIQFSSGSTGDPKGIVLTHENLVENIQSFLTAKKSAIDDSYLSWLPLSHDMGLIGWHLNPLVAGVDHYLMPPVSFVNNPSLWFDKVSEKKISITCAPNFGFSHFLKFSGISPSKNWDLSHVRLIVTGAEHISYTLCNDFLDEMAVFGLQRKALMPGYGLAEATLAVAVTPCGEDFTIHHLDVTSLAVGERAKTVSSLDQHCVTYVDEGCLLPGFEIRICGNDNTILPDETIGHILLKSKSVASGYYNNSAATEASFTQDHWLKTGDLGFLRNNRIVITGRSKEVIIIGGLNFYPHDIERVAAQAKGLRGTSVVACGVYDARTATEELILFVSYKKDLEAFIPIVRSIKEKIAKEFGLPVSRVIPVDAIQRTTSGKIQRVKMGDLFKQGVYHEIIQQVNQLLYLSLKSIDILDNPPTEQLKIMTDYLCEQAKNIIGADRIDPDSSLVSQGFDSLMGIELRNIIECTMGINIPVSWFRKDESVRQFADRIVGKVLKTSFEDTSVTTDELFSPSILDTLKDVDTMNESQLQEMIRSLEN